MAEALVNSMATNFDPTHFTDEFEAALQEVLQAKMEGHAVSQPAAKSEGPAVLDLMAALRASVETAKAARTPVKAVPAAKKAAAKKAAPRKVAATRRRLSGRLVSQPDALHRPIALVQPIVLFPESARRRDRRCR